MNCCRQARARFLASSFLCILIWILTPALSPSCWAKEFLTEKEIEAIQRNRSVKERVPIYLAAAELRLKAAEDRLVGREPAEGDPLEFFTPEDMIEGYDSIIKSVMTNLDEAFRDQRRTRPSIHGVLKQLKRSMERSAAQLEILKRIAEEKGKEELWTLANNAIELTQGALEGANYGLTQEPEPAKPAKKEK